MKKIRAAVIAVITAFFFMGMTTACVGRSESGIIVSGSTSVQPYAEILAEEYGLHHPDKEVDVIGGGSSAGIQAAEAGTADIGMSSRTLKESEEWLWSVEIAKDGLALIIHPDNPVANLTLEQVRAIYALEITKWSELGANLPDAKIHVITREEGSGTRSAFEDLVMDNKRITPKAIVQDSNGAIKQAVGNDKNSIGFISLGVVDANVKALQLDGVAATWDNVVNGSYALFRPFLFVTDGEPTGLAKDFIDYILSPQGQQLLISEGLIPNMSGIETSE